MKKYSSLITAILMLLAGILLIVCKSSVLSWAITIVGVLLIVMSVIDLIDHNYTMFVVRAVLGILLIVLGWTLVSVLFWVFGAILLVYGILQLVNYIRSGTKVGSFVGFMAVYSTPIINIVIGLCLLLCNLGQITDILMVIIGIFFIVEAVASLFGIISKKPRKAKVTKKSK